jgi:hypothetical protein
VAVHDVERLAVEVLRSADSIEDRIAHAPDVGHEVRVGVERAAVVVDTADAAVPRLPAAHPCEDVYIVAPALQRARELGDVCGEPSHRDGMHRLP